MGERPDRGERTSPHSHFHSLKPLLSSSTPSFSLCQEAWLAGNPVTNESTQLLPSSLHFSNNSVSHLSLQKELFPFSIYLQYFSNLFCLHTPLFPSKSNTKSTSKAWIYQSISTWMCIYQVTGLNSIEIFLYYKHGCQCYPQNSILIIITHYKIWQ